MWFRKRVPPFVVGDAVILKDEKEVWNGKPPIGKIRGGRKTFYPDRGNYFSYEIEFPHKGIVEIPEDDLERFRTEGKEQKNLTRRGVNNMSVDKDTCWALFRQNKWTKDVCLICRNGKRKCKQRDEQILLSKNK